MKPKQVRNKPTKTASSKQPQTRKPLTQTASSKQPQTRKPLTLKHGEDFKPGTRLGPFNLPGIAGFFKWPDSSLLQFVAEFIAEEAMIFPDHMPKKSGEDFLCPLAELALAEAAIIARTVIKTPDAESFTFPLPGLAAHRPLTREQTMHYLASMWCQYQDVWGGMSHWLPGVSLAHEQRPSDRFRFAQVHIICETWLVRAGVLEQMDYEGPAHRAAFKHYAAALQHAVGHALDLGLSRK